MLFIVIAIVWIVYFCNSKKVYIFLKRVFGFNAHTMNIKVGELSFEDIVSKCKFLDSVVNNPIENYSEFESEYLFEEWRVVLTSLSDTFLDVQFDDENLLMENAKENTIWNRKKYIPSHYVVAMIDVIYKFDEQVFPKIKDKIKLDKNSKDVLMLEYRQMIKKLNEAVHT